MITDYFQIAKKIYSCTTTEEYWRVIVFVVRALLHNKQMKELMKFFEADAVLKGLQNDQLYAYEQVLRHWFYHNSSVADRVRLIEDHYSFVAARFTEETLKKVAAGEHIALWKQEYGDQVLSLDLCFHDCHKKEGLLAIELNVGEVRAYQAIFWVGRDQNGELSLWIGALQGSPGGLQINHDLTKHCFGYRPKNLILYAIRSFARYFSIGTIYAVSNYGYFTNNHVRLDRKLKTSLDDFWSEIGGVAQSDLRFYKLPLQELRKDLNEVKSQKRNLYRKRFDLLDSIDSTLVNACKKFQIYKRLYYI